MITFAAKLLTLGDQVVLFPAQSQGMGFGGRRIERRASPPVTVTGLTLLDGEIMVRTEHGRTRLSLDHQVAEVAPNVLG